MRAVSLILLAVLGATTAQAAVPVPLELGATSAEPRVAPPSLGAPVAAPAPLPADPKASLFTSPNAPGGDTTLLLKSKPHQCPDTYPWCQRQYASPLAAVQENFAAGVGVDLDGVHLEYAQGTHFSFLGMQSRFSP